MLIHGARQSGKTTLAQSTCAPTYLIGEDGDLALGHSWDDREYSYFSFDDFVTRDAARSDPRGFVQTLPDYVILDEVQRVPELFEAIKIAVDRERIPGRFLLVGSTNVLLVPQLSDSLAGRMRIVPLHPMTQYEISATSNPPQLDSGFFDSLFGNDCQIFQSEPFGARLVEKIVAGGFPAALAQPTLRGRADWYRDYLEAIVQRDVRDISRIRSLDVLPRLLSAAATGTAQLFNLQRLASPFELSRPSIGEYVTLLERLFLLSRLPAWHSNGLKRLVKRPKLHLGDTGLAASLLDAEVEVLKSERYLLGQLLETFVMQELQRQASWQDTRTRLFQGASQNPFF